MLLLQNDSIQYVWDIHGHDAAACYIITMSSIGSYIHSYNTIRRRLFLWGQIGEILRWMVRIDENPLLMLLQ